MTSKLLTASICLFALGAASCPAQSGAGDEQLDPETKARIARFESGPASVDVSSYPKEIQANYQVFKERCTLCHKLSRPINSDYALPDEWSRYVKRMMNKPGSNITKVSAKKIYEFLVFDSAVRKKAMLEEKLAKLPEAERAAEKAKIEELNRAMQGK